MAHELPAKLLLTQELLGCSSRKELCARFREVNPRTEFDLERSHKWLQGRAKPRSARVYEDWARLLGTERAPSWLVACTLDAFVDEVCRISAADPEDLKRRAGLLEQRSGSGQRAGAPAHYVCGDYAAYSHAWSPYFRDQLIRGSILIEPGRGNRFAARYREVLPSGPVELTGPGNLVGRVLHLELHEAGSGAPVYVSIFLSGRPASVLPGRGVGRHAGRPGSAAIGHADRPDPCPGRHRRGTRALEPIPGAGGIRHSGQSRGSRDPAGRPPSRRRGTPLVPAGR